MGRFRPLLLSHFSIATALGLGAGPTLAALRANHSGLRARDFEGGLTTWVGEIEHLDDVRFEPRLTKFDCRNNRMAALALAQDGFSGAVEVARDRYGPHRIGLCLGTSTAGIHETERAYRKRDHETGALPPNFRYAETHNTFSVAAFVADALRLTGPAIAISTACSTTAKAFGSAARMIAAGLCDAAIVGGADTLCATTLYGFRSLGVISSGPCRPFDSARDGLSLGEAGGFALIEKPGAHAPSNGVLLLGVGESSDFYHMSSPDPEGMGARLSMERALAASGLTAKDIDYINVHGTATPIGDAAEDCAITSLFGTKTACSSTKSHTGHTLGAAGIVETILSCLALQNGVLPGSPHTQRTDPALHSRYIIESCATRIDRALSNSFGFGGSNCSLVLGRA